MASAGKSLRDLLAPAKGSLHGFAASCFPESGRAQLLAVHCTNLPDKTLQDTLAAPLRPLVKDAGPLLMIGWDAGDWQTIDPLLDKGEMPNLARLIQNGVRAPMKSRQPMLSPLLWTSMATGLSPEQHGVLDFLVKDPKSGGTLPITSRWRKAPAIWNITSAAGKRSAVFAWWATYPAEPIDGVMITERAFYSLFKMDPGKIIGPRVAWPPGVLSALKYKPVQPEGLTLAQLRPFIPAMTEADLADAHKILADPAATFSNEAHLMKILAKTINYHEIALAVWDANEADKSTQPYAFFSPYYEAVDEMCHRFMHFMPPKHNLTCGKVPLWQCGADRA